MRHSVSEKKDVRASKGKMRAKRESIVTRERPAR